MATQILTRKQSIQRAAKRNYARTCFGSPTHGLTDMLAAWATGYTIERVLRAEGRATLTLQL